MTSTMRGNGTARGSGGRRRRHHTVDQVPRFGAIRAIVGLAHDDEEQDAAAEALLAMGVTPQELTAALLGTS